jgi:hypothetical protein
LRSVLAGITPSSILGKGKVCRRRVNTELVRKELDRKMGSMTKLMSIQKLCAELSPKM